MLVSVEDIRKLAEGILTANGVPEGHARTQASLFIEAEMRAIPSHGLLRLRRVIERIHAGLSVPGARGDQKWTARSFLSVDGQRGLGPVVAMAALDTIIPRAREDGIAIAAVRNTNHLGALAYYAEDVASKVHEQIKKLEYRRDITLDSRYSEPTLAWRRPTQEQRKWAEDTIAAGQKSASDLSYIYAKRFQKMAEFPETTPVPVPMVKPPAESLTTTSTWFDTETRARPGSPGSRRPLPFASLKTTPLTCACDTV